jgi:IMP dehydrogenase
VQISARGLTFDDVLLVPAYNGIKSRQLVTTAVKLNEFEFQLPIASANMDTITEDAMANAITAEGGMAILHRFSSIADNVEMFRKCRVPGKVGVSIGVGSEAMERANALVSVGAQIVCVDVAHGHSKDVNRMVRELRAQFKRNVLIIAGNIATYAGADYLAAAGADVIKVGIGPGSVCSTRIKTGFGVPQLSAILECRKVDRPLIADGGIKTPGDVVKALAAGAEMVMLGGMLAGTDETPGQIVERTQNGQVVRFKSFRGMASREAQEAFMGGMAEWKTAEGVAVEVISTGPVLKVLRDIAGGLRSGLTYCGAENIRDMQRKAQFVEVTQAARVEGSPHAIGRITI